MCLCKGRKEGWANGRKEQTKMKDEGKKDGKKGRTKDEGRKMKGEGRQESIKE